MKGKNKNLNKIKLNSNFQLLTSDNRGITLIALVITIIVMLILVGVTINMAVNGGLFGYAGSAVEQTKTARDEEQNYVNLPPELTYTELINKFTSSSSNVTNPYASETPAHTWACDTSGNWSDATGSETSGILAKVYERETEYHLVIEPVGETGTMGAVHEHIGRNDFYYAWQSGNEYRSNITKVVICDGITNIGRSAFGGIISLTDIKISKDVISIDHGAFAGCSFTSFTIPQGITTIGTQAFANSNSLTNITIPNNVTNIGESAFLNCSQLTSITYTGTMAEWNTITKDTYWLGYDNPAPVTTVKCSDGDISI